MRLMPVRRFPHGPCRIAAAALVTTMACALPGAACADTWFGSSWFGASEEPAPLHVVQDPHYGDTLFEFYQGHYFTSVTHLMVSQHFHRVEHHADEAEVLRGGLLLSYGLHREAGEIFARLIETTTSAKVRDRAWYFLAKIRYQRGALREAEEAVDRIGSGPGNANPNPNSQANQLPPELEEERALLKANLLLSRGDYAGASTLLDSLKLKGNAAAYVRYNLGVALIRNGDTTRGTALLDELGRAPAANEEMRNLRDKTNLALGFAALQDNQAEGARTYLERVRLNGMFANKAMLGFGWAEAALNKPDRALVPWVELTKRDASDAAVLEARIAVPYALAELGAFGQSLDRYQDAILLYDAEKVALDESIVAIRAGKLVEGLLARNPGEDMGWFWNIVRLPEMPHARHLAPVLAEHQFQEAFKSYRDLQFLTRNLQDWQEKLGVFSDMLTTRTKAFNERLPQILAIARDGGFAVQQQRAAALTAEVDRIESGRDGAASVAQLAAQLAAPLADERQQDLLQRLGHVKAELARITPQDQPREDTEAARERLRRVAGALDWELTQAYPARAWEARKSVRIINRELAEAQVREAALSQAKRDEPARFAAFAARIAELDQRIKALLPRVAALSREQQEAVQEIAVAQLSEQEDRLAAYAVQARFAVAQLYDRANAGTGGNAGSADNTGNAAKESDHAARP
jgi:hypothetical protein